MIELSDDVRAMLAQAGWTPDRRVDPSVAVDALHSAGFAVPEAAVEFLSRFAFLTVRHPARGGPGEPVTSSTSFEPAEAATPRDAWVAERCGRLVGAALCPVGIDGFHATIYITADDTFFAGRDSFVGRYGDSTAAFLAALHDGRGPTEIAEWYIDGTGAERHP